MQDLIIAGASGFGRELLMVIKEINSIEEKWNVLGFIDDNKDALKSVECSHKVLGTIDDYYPNGNVLCALGIASPRVKKTVTTKLKERGTRFATIIHPTARIGNPTVLGEGLVMFPYSDISVNCNVGDFVFLNSFAQVGHDSVIGDCCTLFPNCAIAGGGMLGKGVLIGTGASTYPGIKMGNYATVGMNSAVIRNVKENSTVMGVPAKRIM